MKDRWLVLIVFLSVGVTSARVNEMTVTRVSVPQTQGGITPWVWTTRESGQVSRSTTTVLADTPNLHADLTGHFEVLREPGWKPNEDGQDGALISLAKGDCVAAISPSGDPIPESFGMVVQWLTESRLGPVKPLTEMTSEYGTYAEVLRSQDFSGFDERARISIAAVGMRNGSFVLMFVCSVRDFWLKEEAMRMLRSVRLR